MARCLVFVPVRELGEPRFFYSLMVMCGLMAVHALYKGICDPFPAASGESASFQMQAPLTVGSVLMESMPHDASPDA